MIVTIILFRLTGAGKCRNSRRRRRRKEKTFYLFFSFSSNSKYPIFKIAKKHNMESDEDKNGKEISKTKKIRRETFSIKFSILPQRENSQEISLISTRILRRLHLSEEWKNHRKIFYKFSPVPRQKFHISPEKTRSRARMMLVLRRTLTQM